MARINIEDSLFKEDGFLELVEKIGNRYTAIGLAVSAFSLAQKYHLSHGYIPKDKFPEQMSVLVQCRLVSVQKNSESETEGFYVHGSKEQFAWLSQKSSAGSVISEKKNEQLKKAREAKKIKKQSETSERDLNGVCTGLNGSEAPTPTPTPTLNSNSSSDSNLLTEGGSKNKKNRKSGLTELEQEQNKKIKEAYFKAYAKAYGLVPATNAKLHGQINTLRKSIGFEDAEKVVVFYLAHTDSKYLLNTHTFGLCLLNCETLRTQMLRGRPITINDVRRFEKAKAVNDMIQEAKKGGF